MSVYLTDSPEPRIESLEPTRTCSYCTHPILDDEDAEQTGDGMQHTRCVGAESHDELAFALDDAGLADLPETCRTFDELLDEVLNAVDWRTTVRQAARGVVERFQERCREEATDEMTTIEQSFEGQLDVQEIESFRHPRHIVLRIEGESDGTLELALTPDQAARLERGLKVARAKKSVPVGTGTLR